MNLTRLRRSGVLLLTSLVAAPAAGAEDQPFSIQVDAGALWQARNKVQIPNDANGTKFSLEDPAGSGPWATVRVEATWAINEKHGIRLLAAPLSYDETGFLAARTRFAGATFDPDQPVKAEYRFNSWRVGYRYHLVDRSQWDLFVGGTLKIRDAEIKLTQGATSSLDDDVGVVPLLYLGGEYRFDDRWSVAADVDGLAGGPGRAIDLGVRVNYQVGEQWQLGVGYRTLEGGVDNDDVYNFSWFNSLLFSARYRF